MKFIILEVLHKLISETESENQSYQNVLEELNLSTETEEVEEEMFWKTVYFNRNVLEEEMFCIEDRVDFEETNCIMSFFDGRTVIINKSKKELTDLLSDTV